MLLPCQTPFVLPPSANAHTSHAYMAAHFDDASSDRGECLLRLMGNDETLETLGTLRDRQKLQNESAN